MERGAGAERGGAEAGGGRAAAPSGGGGGGSPGPGSRSSSSEQGGGTTRTLRLLLLGKQRAGKSATGNTILGRAAFASGFGSQNATVRCRRESGAVLGRRVVVIDTPDIFSPLACAEARPRLVRRCLELAAPALHALLLVVPVGNYTAEDEQACRGLREALGAEAARRVLLVFTRRDELGDNSLQDYIESRASLSALVGRHEGRCYAVDNKAGEGERAAQAAQLLGEVERLVEHQGAWLVDVRSEGHGFQDRVNGAACQERADAYGKSRPRGQLSGASEKLLGSATVAETEERKEMYRQGLVHEGRGTLNIILVGRSGTGKSATGNTILGRQVFLSQLRAQPVTQKCQSGRRTWNGQDVVVVDTPSLLAGAGKHESWLEEEVRRCLSFCERGVRIFVLVFQLGRFTQEDERAALDLETIFGKEVVKYTIVLFTREEDLRGGTIEDYTENTDNKALKRLIKKQKCPVCAFNNRATDQTREAQVNDLLKKANDLRKSHKGSGYSSPWENIGYRNKNAQKMYGYEIFTRTLKNIFQ